MSTINFIYQGISTIIQCSEKEKMKIICDKYCHKINIDINSLIFLYGGNRLNMDKTYEEYTKENKISILVYKNENEICPKCGKMLDDNIRMFNNNINSMLIGLKNQIDHIIKDINDINEIRNQL